MPTAVVKASTTVREFPSLWRPLLDEVWAFLRATPGLWTGGHNVFLYRSDPSGAELAVEVGRCCLLAAGLSRHGAIRVMRW